MGGRLRYMQTVLTSIMNSEEIATHPFFLGKWFLKKG